MLDWTGERFVPWAKEAAVAYEHLHRYIWTSSFAEGKSVLDLASGEGYGAQMIACRASLVVGIDIDGAAIRHASQKYRRANLQFLQGALTAVPIQGHSFDIITCFEAIEHIEQHDDLLREVRRLLRPGGAFVVSTPNKDIYKAGTEEPNPFHLKELSFEEFDSLLHRHFPRVKYLGQRVHAVSSMWPLEKHGPATIREFAVERRDQEFRSVSDNPRAAVYFIAVASEVAETEHQGSILLDYADEFIKDKNEALSWLQEQVNEFTRQNNELTERNEEFRRRVESAETELGRRSEELALIHSSRAWKLVLWLRAIRDKLTGK